MDPTLHDLNARADALEAKMAAELQAKVITSRIYNSGEMDPTRPMEAPDLAPGQHYQMGEDPRLAKMPDKPTLADFFRLRFGASAHMLQSARLAMQRGLPEKIVLACLLHDISVVGFIRADHGYWGAQLVEPYVDEEVAWAIRAHQVLRFYPDESVGYEYPKAYLEWLGADFRPDPFIDAAYQRARDHRWYMSARLVTLNDLYAFDPTVQVELDEFADIIGRNFRQPQEGLGWDDTPATHMWRTIIAPTKFL